MAAWACVLFVGLLAFCHGVSQCTAAAGNQELALESSHQIMSIPVTTVGTAVETNIVVSELFHNLSAFATIHKRSSDQIQTTQNVDLSIVTQSGSSSTYPTLSVEDVSGPDPSFSTSFTYRPIATQVAEGVLQGYGDTFGQKSGPQKECPLDGPSSECLQLRSQEGGLSRRDDDNDGYGFGYGSSTTPVENGGYGNPPQPTILPPGAYGNQQTPEINKLTVVEVPDPDPQTATVSLEYRTSSVVQSSSTTPGPVIVVIVTGTGESVSQTPEHNVTQTVTTSDPMMDPSPEVTLLVPSTSTRDSIIPSGSKSVTISTESYVYTTVTQSSSTSLSHAGSSTNTIYTVTGRPTPRPVDTNGAISSPKPHRYYLVIAAIVVICPYVVSLFGGISSRLGLSKDNTRHCASEETKGDASEDDSNGNKTTAREESNTPGKCCDVEPSQSGCCPRCLC
ncbi:uncharacterized protein F4812DRAFT_465613 [Daldinia caldariorum]|uniref:uncharacterized protein n=1 Tax=Daldinia caldariorum TaxID=326644 RepID=UPI0020089320|nr:uncharacterized protein F4812DRAFT_465613 [Daldinia caldariorum]KAI1466962.1 hypothetical protein F4812DRAFT_465613 [Daldinia caldariorum]